MGFDFDGTPRLYQTDPSGTYHAWKVHADVLAFPPAAPCEALGCMGLNGRGGGGDPADSTVFQANAIGRGAKSVREFLEKNYTDEAIETDDLTIKLVIKALLEVSLCVGCGGRCGQDTCGRSLLTLAMSAGQGIAYWEMSRIRVWALFGGQCGQKPMVPVSLQVVQSGGKNIELAVMRRDQPLKVTSHWPEGVQWVTWALTPSGPG